jgi:hypothetical protein
MKWTCLAKFIGPMNICRTWWISILGSCNLYIVLILKRTWTTLSPFMLLILVPIIVFLSFKNDNFFVWAFTIYYGVLTCKSTALFKVHLSLVCWLTFPKTFMLLNFLWFAMCRFSKLDGLIIERWNYRFVMNW